MARTAKNEKKLTPEEKLAQALVPDVEQPYRVPKNWNWVYFGSICNFINGYAFKSKLFSSDVGVPVIRISDIADNVVSLDNAIKTTEESIEDRFIVRQGDLLIAMSGATTGKNGIYLSTQKAFLNQRVGNIKIVHQNLVLPFFRNYYIQLQTEEILKNAYGGAQPNISSNKICEMSFPLPPIAEQQRIVDRIESLFAKLDEAKEKAQAVVDGFEDRKEIILHQAFAGDLTNYWRNLHGVSKADWETVHLSDTDVCTVNPSKINTKDLPDDLEVSFFPMPALSEIYGAITEPQTRKLSEVRTGFTNFSEGDVVFAKITPCMENGKSAVIGPLVNNIGFGTTEFYVLRCGKKLYNRFLWHLVRSLSFRNEAKSVMSGAVGQQRVPKSFLENYYFSLPSIEEQIEIVRLLDNLFTKEQQAKEAAEQVIDQIDTMKKSILARAFRGELGTNDPADECAMELLKRVLGEEESTEPRQKQSRKRISIPKEISAILQNDLEKKIVSLYYQKEVMVLTIKEIASVSSKTFDVLDCLKSLQDKKIIIKLENGNYKLVG